MDNIFCKYY